MRMKTQDDIVAQDQGFKTRESTYPVRVPGIMQLHLKSTDEIAEVLAVVLKSERNITRLDWKLGEYMNVTVRND